MRGKVKTVRKSSPSTGSMKKATPSTRTVTRTGPTKSRAPGKRTTTTKTISRGSRYG